MNSPVEDAPREVGRRGLMLVLSSPSGAGKSTIARLLLDSDDNISMSVSVTTRPPRPGEVEGVDYRFIMEAEYLRLASGGQLLEYAKVFDNYYGTPRRPVEEALAAGRDVLFDVDWQGAQRLAQNAGKDMVSVFILPPSNAELERRLRGRAQDSEQVVRNRMSKAAAEMSHWAEYDYVIVNREIEDSIAGVRAILAAERHKRDRLMGLAEFVAALSGD